jgi:hypothetical protein
MGGMSTLLIMTGRMLVLSVVGIFNFGRYLLKSAVAPYLNWVLGLGESHYR